MDTGTVNIHGREYKTVALRVSEFRERCPAADGWAIVTELVERTAEYVIVRAQIVKEGVTLASGLAEEMRNSSQINRTSALENCETSAIGRALAAFGLGGSEYASANEVQNAVQQQKAPKLTVQEKRYVDDAMKEIKGCDSLEALAAVGEILKGKSPAVQGELRAAYGQRQRELKEQAVSEDLPY